MGRDQFLDQLIGSWDLRGEMGTVSLHQRVAARWVLADRFVEVSCTELDGTPYEALYLIGRSPSGRYVLILADSTGVPAEPESMVGTGDRAGDAVEFVFKSDGGKATFTNRFEWDVSDGSWTHRLVGTGADGARTPFAVKRLTRLPGL